MYVYIHLFELGIAKPDVGWVSFTSRSEGRGFYKEEVETKEGNYLIVYNLSQCLTWGSPCGWLWVVMLTFLFLWFKDTDSGLGSGLLSEGIRTNPNPMVPCLLSFLIPYPTFKTWADKTVSSIIRALGSIQIFSKLRPKRHTSSASLCKLGAWVQKWALPNCPSFPASTWNARKTNH